MLSDGTDPNIPEYRETFVSKMCEICPFTPLGFAATNDDIRAVELLLEFGATPAHIEGSASYPLTDTITTNGINSLEIVKLLVEEGADPYESDGYDNAFYTIARKYCVNKSQEDCQRLVDIMDFLLDSSGESLASISEKSERALSLATTAIYHGRNARLIQYLLNNGDSVDTGSTFRGVSFFDWCHMSENKEILIILEEYGYFMQ
jgi:ankyrin repeat protein